MTVFYVDASRPDDGGDGVTWATAFRHLQSALAVATDGDEIWVAAGTYAPDEGTGQTANDRDATFRMKDGVAIYGGFAGGEVNRAERNPATHVTTLDGMGIAYHVVTSDGNAPTAVLDGFTITGGNADGLAPNDCGGGVYTLGSQAHFANLTISGNTASTGGGVYNRSSSPSFTNVTISGNTARAAGGVSNFFKSSPSFTNVTISGNTASTAGGVSNFKSSPSFTNVTISGNTATRDCGGVSNFKSSPSFTNVLISGNAAGEFDAGVKNFGGSPSFINVTIVGNQARIRGEGVYNAGSSPSFTNCIIWRGGQTALVSNNNSTPTYAHCLVQGATLAGTGNLPGYIDPMFVDPVWTWGDPTTGGDYRLLPESPVRDRGDNAANSTTTDLDGNPRIVGMRLISARMRCKPNALISPPIPAAPFRSGGGTPWAEQSIPKGSGNEANRCD